MSSSTVDGPRKLAVKLCTNANCEQHRQEMKLMLRLLAPALQPGGSPVDALMYIIDQARQVQRTRDAYRAALTRVTQLYNLGEQQGGIVRTAALSQALFVTAEDA